MIMAWQAADETTCCASFLGKDDVDILQITFNPLSPKIQQILRVPIKVIVILYKKFQYI